MQRSEKQFFLSCEKIHKVARRNISMKSKNSLFFFSALAVMVLGAIKVAVICRKTGDC